MKKLRIGVVGVGHIGSNHARIYSELPNAELVAILDIDLARADEIGAKYKAKAMASLNEFAGMIDAASVATPTSAHFSIARDLLAHGKHLLIEKPITEKTSDARDLAQVAAEKGLVLQVGHVERFNPVLSALEQRLTHPRMIHDLEIILHLVDSTLENIDAVGVPVLSRGEDIANARLRFASGCIANVTSSRISPEKMRKIRVFQEDAYLSLDYQGQSGEIYRRVDGQITREPVAIEKEEPLRQQLASFVDCALTGGEPRVSGSHAAAALELAVEITRRIAAS